jgi:rRNA-processing protein FCF1
MVDMLPMFVFLDTNTFLHFRSIREIDWREVLKAPTVELIITQAVIRELDDIKESSRKQRKIRERAASALKLLKALRQKPQIRDGVMARFQPHEPQIDFVSSKLSIHVEDDWIIAAILEHRLNTPDSVVRLLTADEALQVKADGHNIPHLELPEIHRLPPVLDDDQKRIQELELEVQKLKNAQPDLKLLFEGSESNAYFPLPTPTQLSAHEIATKISEIRTAHPTAPTGGFNPLITSPNEYVNFFIENASITPADIDRHNGRLETFYRAYETYLRRVNDFCEIRSRTIQLDILLVNRGSTPANDIDIYMHLPDGLEVFESFEDEVPVEPIAPSKPMSLMEESLSQIVQLTMGPSAAMFDRHLGVTARDLVPRNVSGPTIRRTNSFEVRIHVRDLKHNLQTKLDPLFVRFDNLASVKSFPIGYSLYAANVPDAISGKLHVILRRT